MLGFVDGIALGCVLGTADGCALGLPFGLDDGWLLGVLLGADDGSIDATTNSEDEPVTVLPVAAAALSSKAIADAVVLTPTQLSTQVISVVTVASDSTSSISPFVPMFKIVTVTVFERKS